MNTSRFIPMWPLFGLGIHLIFRISNTRTTWHTSISNICIQICSAWTCVQRPKIKTTKIQHTNTHNSMWLRMIQRQRVKCVRECVSFAFVPKRQLLTSHNLGGFAGGVNVQSVRHSLNHFSMLELSNFWYDKRQHNTQIALSHTQLKYTTRSLWLFAYCSC